MPDPKLCAWLLESDPAIRWQVLADLEEAQADIVARERSRLASEGWGARLLALQDADGQWSGSLYNRKWISTTYTLYLLKVYGLPRGHPQTLAGCEQLIQKGAFQEREIRFSRGQAVRDLGVCGLVLSVCAYFGCQHALLPDLATFLISQQQADGSWLPNDAPGSQTYTFETTLLILEGLRQYRLRYLPPAEPLMNAEIAGQGFLLRQRLYLDDAGRPIKGAWTSFSFPPYWFYDVLNALDYFQAAGAPRDDHLQPAIDLLVSKRRSDGTWNLGRRHPGEVFFEMETSSQPSKWNTLRALRVLRWWQAE